MDQVVLPELRCPFPSAVNEHAEAVHQGTIDWLQHFELVTDAATYQRFHASKLGWLAARFHPPAPYEELQLVSDWYAWAFFRDDQRDDSDLGKHPERLARTDGRFLDILRGADPVRQDEPLAYALHDLRQRLKTRVPSKIWMRRFIRSVKEHLDATEWEATNRARGITPDFETYSRIRHVTGGLYVDAELIDMTRHIRLPPEVRGHHIVQRLTVASNNVVCWVNDIFSLDKEMKRGDVHNLVLVLQHEQGLTLPEAVRRAVEMNNAEVDVFVDLERRLPSFGMVVDANVKQYVAALRARARGNLDWSIETGRYQRPVLVKVRSPLVATRALR